MKVYDHPDDLREAIGTVLDRRGWRPGMAVLAKLGIAEWGDPQKGVSVRLLVPVEHARRLLKLWAET